MENLEKIIGEALQKELPQVVSTVVEAKVKEATAGDKEEIEALKTEVKTLRDAKGSEMVHDEKIAKSILVNTFKKVKKFGVASEEQFGEIFDAEIKAAYQNESTATEWKEFVFELFSKDVYAIFDKYNLVSELRTINITGKSINLPKYDGGVEAYWLDEGGNFTASKGATGNLKIDVYKLGVLVGLTDEMLADDMTNDTLYALIVEEAWVKFAAKIEDELLNGNNSTGKMKGILTNPGIKVVTSTATSFGAITEADLLDADALIDDKYNINPANKVAVMLKSTFNSLRQKRDANGVLLYPELRDATPTLIGYRVLTSSKMPAQATNAIWVLFGNIADFYYHISRQGFSSEMGYIDGDFQGGRKSLRIDRRDGWAVKDANAFAVVKIGTVA